MRYGYIFLAFLVLAVGHAQKNYIGVGASLVALSTYGYDVPPLLSVQVGEPAAPAFGGLEARAALDTILIFSNLSVDVLASVRPPDALLRLYFGGGPDVLIFAPLDSPPEQEQGLAPVFFGLHGTAGLELLTGNARPFAELQPAAALLYGSFVYGLKGRAGLNLYF